MPPLPKGRRLGIERNEPLQLPGLLVALQAVDEVDLDLRGVKAGCGEPRDDVLTKRRDVDRPGRDHADLSAGARLENLILGNVGVLAKRCPKNQRVDMDAAGINEDVVRATLHAADEGEIRAARA